MEKLIWINGPFAGGKTAAAFELFDRLPDAFVFDPENVGFYIRDNLPRQAKSDDFRDYPEWREFNYRMLKRIDETYNGVVLAPMTVTEPRHAREIFGKLRNDGVKVDAYMLVMNDATHKKRRHKRFDGVGSWAAKRWEECKRAYLVPELGEHISVDSLSVSETAEEIARRSGLSLGKRRGVIGGALHRLAVQLKHIR